MYAALLWLRGWRYWRGPRPDSYQGCHKLQFLACESGRTIDAGYDAGGRPTGLVYPEATVDYLYAAGDRTGRISSIVRTPTGVGTSQRITYTYDGPLVTQSAVSGVTTGTTSYSYDNNFLLSAINLSSGGDTFNSAITRDNDGLITQFGPFSYTRSGPAGAVSAISGLTLNLTLGYDNLGRLSGKTYTVNSIPIFQSAYTYYLLKEGGQGDAHESMLNFFEEARGTPMKACLTFLGVRNPGNPKRFNCQYLILWQDFFYAKTSSHRRPWGNSPYYLPGTGTQTDLHGRC